MVVQRIDTTIFYFMVMGKKGPGGNDVSQPLQQIPTCIAMS